MNIRRKQKRFQNLLFQIALNQHDNPRIKELNFLANAHAVAPELKSFLNFYGIDDNGMGSEWTEHLAHEWLVNKHDMNNLIQLNQTNFADTWT